MKIFALFVQGKTPSAVRTVSALPSLRLPLLNLVRIGEAKAARMVELPTTGLAPHQLVGRLKFRVAETDLEHRDERLMIGF